MPRIRTIKPEFWTSEQIVECSTNARLLFIGLWTFADDSGIHPASTKRLKMEIFPGDPFTDEEVDALVGELIANDLVRRYSVDGKDFWIVTGWADHQRIDRPNPKYPRPLDDHSTNVRRAVVGRSPPERKRKGKETEGKRKGKEEKGDSGDEVEEISMPANLAGEKFVAAWGEWIAYRTERKLTKTSRTLKQQLAKLSTVGPERAIECLEQSIECGWAGIFPDKKGEKNGQRTTSPGQRFAE